MIVKCKICSEKIDRDKAYKVIVNEKNNYYCNEDEYKKSIEKQIVKDNTYKEIYNLFGMKVTNTALYKEVGELANIYTYEKILGYLIQNNPYLSKVMVKDFVSEYAKIRYFTAILKNSLADFKVEQSTINKEIVIDMPKDNFKSKQRKKSLSEYETEVGDEL
jgi:hypothetical protein